MSPTNQVGAHGGVRTIRVAVFLALGTLARRAGAIDRAPTGELDLELEGSRAWLALMPR